MKDNDYKTPNLIENESRTYFISYNQADKEWAEWIAWIIEEEIGYKTIIQAWDFLPGNSWTEQMYSNLKKCTAVIAVLSDDFLKSKFAASEWQSAFAQDPIGEKRFLIPIRVKECKPDVLLNERIYVDLVGKEKSVSKKLIKDAIIGKRTKPIKEPKFPGEEPPFPGEVIVTKETFFHLVLDGEFTINEKEKVEILTEHLRKFLKDFDLTIMKVEKGSFVLTIKSKKSTYRLLKKIYKENPNLLILGNKILGMWEIDSLSKLNPLVARLENIKTFVINYLKESVGEEEAKDIYQDFVMSMLSSGDSKYFILSNPTKIIQVVDKLLQEYLNWREEDERIREIMDQTNPNKINREEILRLSISLFEKLNSEEQEYIENYWSARFEGDDLLDEIDSFSKERLDSIKQKIRRIYLGDDDLD